MDLSILSLKLEETFRQAQEEFVRMRDHSRRVDELFERINAAISLEEKSKLYGLYNETKFAWDVCRERYQAIMAEAERLQKEMADLIPNSIRRPGQT